MEIAVLFGLVIGLLLLGVPIAISLGLSSLIFLIIYADGSLASIAQTLFTAFDGHYTLLAIPFFILASAFMSTGGVAKRIIDFAIASVGDCERFRLYVVRGAVRVFARNRGGDWLHRDRWHAAGRIFQGIRRRGDL